MKEFNVTGLCIPQKHYMVDISSKLEKIIEMVDKDWTLEGLKKSIKMTMVQRESCQREKIQKLLFPIIRKPDIQLFQLLSIY